MNSRTRVALFLAALLTLSGCGGLDGYADAFARVEIGDTTDRAIEILGEPSTRQRVEIPLVTLEDLAWRSRLSGRVYMVHTVLGRVVTKSVIE